MRRVVLSALLVTFGIGLFTGCTSKEKQLEDVAKDWCLTIRASQVVPVYPLTEDLQPGDVFLVTTPIQQQVEIYEERGFLPLDQSVTRLVIPKSDYKTFYGPSYWSGNYGDNLPNPRPMPKPDGTGTVGGQEVLAPRAAFPSYTFEVSSGGGLGLAIPLSSVPIGLGLMKSEEATGSVTISDAFTYGLSNEQVLTRLNAWLADNPQVAYKLAELAQATEQTLFLRVVSRVYLTGGVSVSVQSQESSSLGLDVGKKQDVPLFDRADAASAAEDYKKALATLNETLKEGALPGGSVRLAQASRRSVTLSERFDRPIVIGYLGFDVPIRPLAEVGRVFVKGRSSVRLLGTPIATLDMLEERSPRIDSVLTEDDLDLTSQFNALSDELRSNPAGVVERVRRALSRLPAEPFGRSRRAASDVDTPQKAEALLGAFIDEAGFYASKSSETSIEVLRALR